MSRTVANNHPAVDQTAGEWTRRLRYGKYRRTHDSSTISPRPSMTGSERKVMSGEGRSENQRANSFLDVLVLGDLSDVYIPEQMPGANLVP